MAQRHHERSGNRAVVLVAVALATVAWLSPVTSGHVQAASCNGASHPTPVLDDGSASPGSGTTATRITFRVRYVDGAGCPPNRLDLVVVGLGRYRMTGNGTAFTSGVTFSVSRKLPVGSWPYYFAGTSGSGTGERSVALTKVSPTEVVIKAAAPKPTAKPTPKPTPRPTPKPTARPRSTSAPSTTAKPGTASPRGPSASPAAATATSTPGHPYAGPTGGSGGGGGPTRPAGGGLDGGSSWALGVDPGIGLPLAAWSLTTAFGVVTFGVLLLPVRRRRGSPEIDPAGLTLLGSSTVAAEWRPNVSHPVTEIGAAIADSDGRSADTGEADRPPWLRRGLRDGRAGGDQPTGTSRREATRFKTPPRRDAERHTITYRYVRVSDGPDELTSNEVGRLDRGDEIEVIGEHEGALRIRTPSGLEGWVPRVVIVG